VGQPQVFALELSERESDSALSTLLQDLTQDSTTLTGWRRTKQSGEGKMIALYGPGISSFMYRSFLALLRNPEFSGDFHRHQSGKSLAHAGILHSSRIVKYQYGQVSKCSRINGGLFAFPEVQFSRGEHHFE
jgi:hypothetical protein